MVALQTWKLSGNVVRGCLVLALIFVVTAGRVTAAQGPEIAAKSNQSQDDRVVLPPSVPDPLEPVNRTVWAFNRGVLLGIVKPTSKIYRAVVPKPVRTGIGNFGRNINYPGRLLNHLLQGRWHGAGQETDRFFCNSIVGLGGFFDVASRHGIPKSDADFGQTLGHWGWRPQCFVMLPVFGPSNERDTLGLAADAASNPLTYITPYSITEENPLTFISPYAYFSYAVIYNNLSDSVDDLARFVKADTDPYALIQYAWTFVRDPRAPTLRGGGEVDPVSLETLGSVLVQVTDPRFPDRAKTRSVRVPATGRRLQYDCWLQPARAPLVYFVPGLGSNRRAALVLSLAEMLYQNGFSVAAISSPFNPEFMENASTSALPAYAPGDSRDLHAALTAIDQDLAARHPHRLGRRALMGYSMGGFETLLVAAGQGESNGLVRFDRFVAVDTPVRLMHGVSKLDEFYNAPLAWPAEERPERLRNTFARIATSGTAGLKPGSAEGLRAIESQFLIGLAFRFILRDVIYSSQRRENLGILHHRLTSLRRGPAYDEILQYSFVDYFEKFAAPYFGRRDARMAEPDALARSGDLRTYEPALATDSRLRVLVNENDFLLATEDLAWLRRQFGPDRLKTFPRGGHLGNLGDPAVRAAIIAMLSGLENP